MSKDFKSFSEFYPFYLTEHVNKKNRVLHFIGTSILILIFIYALISGQYKLLWLCPLIGYGFAWAGHMIFEKNRPATFKNPFYSLASDFVMNTGKFVDECLEKLYGVEKFYNFKNKEDTIGHLLIGLAPHTSAGIVGRIIGYSRTQGCFSHPVWHAAQRRNLDGDENGVMLLLDGLINFSREYLPDRRGAKTMDTSLVLTSHLYLDQIDDEVHGMDIVPYYSLEMYRAAKKFKNPKEIKITKVENKISEIETDKKYLGYGFTHNTDDLNNTIMCSSYKSVPSMKEKMNLQLELGKKIRAVDEHQVGSFIIDKHFMKDIKGNLRKFGMQTFRCTNCNTSYRRPPLNGKCIHCKKSSINFTIHEGSIKKYLHPSFDIVKNYNVDPYIVETLELTNLRIEGVFGKQKNLQKSLEGFFGK
jgi:DNA polymerase II large subunit